MTQPYLYNLDLAGISGVFLSDFLSVAGHREKNRSAVNIFTSSKRFPCYGGHAEISACESVGHGTNLQPFPRCLIGGRWRSKCKAQLGLIPECSCEDSSPTFRTSAVITLHVPCNEYSNVSHKLDQFQMR